MLEPRFQYKKAENKEEALARWKARRETQLTRDREIQRIVDRYGVVTPAIVCALLGVNPTPQTTNERTQMRIIYRRLQRLTEHGRFRAHSEFTILAKHAKRRKPWQRRVRAGAVYYSSFNLAQHERHQFEHKSLIAHIRGTLEGLDDFETLKTDTELRDAKAPLVYDLYGKLGQVRLALEANRSDHPKEVSRRCVLWLRYIKSSDPTFPADRYLWIVETEWKARNIRQRWIEDGLTSGEWLFAIIEAGPKSCHTRLKCAFAYCVHFVDHTPSAGSA